MRGQSPPEYGMTRPDRRGPLTSPPITDTNPRVNCLKAGAKRVRGPSPKSSRTRNASSNEGVSNCKLLARSDPAAPGAVRTDDRQYHDQQRGQQAYRHGEPAALRDQHADEPGADYAPCSAEHADQCDHA